MVAYFSFIFHNAFCSISDLGFKFKLQIPMWQTSANPTTTTHTCNRKLYRAAAIRSKDVDLPTAVALCLRLTSFPYTHTYTKVATHTYLPPQSILKHEGRATGKQRAQLPQHLCCVATFLERRQHRRCC